MRRQRYTLEEQSLGMQLGPQVWTESGGRREEATSRYQARTARTKLCALRGESDCRLAHHFGRFFIARIASRNGASKLEAGVAACASRPIGLSNEDELEPGFSAHLGVGPIARRWKSPGCH